MTSRSTYEATAATAHNSANFGGITFPDGTVNSRTAAAAALAAGGSFATYVATMNKIANWEQEQISTAKSVLRATGDLAPA